MFRSKIAPATSNNPKQRPAITLLLLLFFVWPNRLGRLGVNPQRRPQRRWERGGRTWHDAGEMASQCFVVAQGEMAQSKEGAPITGHRSSRVRLGRASDRLRWSERDPKKRGRWRVVDHRPQRISEGCFSFGDPQVV